MWQLFVGSFALSIIHALIPNHWLPLVAIAKTERWNSHQTVVAAFATSLAHMISTILVGVLVGYIGVRLSEKYDFITHYVAPSILVVIGIIFLASDLISTKKHEHKFRIDTKKGRIAIIASLCIAMFLTPCLEIDVYYFQAATLGWVGIALVSVVYLVVTMSSIVGLVYLGFKGLMRFNTHFLEHHAKSITGVILIALGIVSYFVEF